MNSVTKLLLEPAELEAMLSQENLLIVDVCQPQNWQKLHLPGAVHINPSALVCGIPPAPGKLPSLPLLQEMFASIGYKPEQHIVVYDDEGGGWAGRFIWMLDVIGHKQYSYLNGGLYAWYKEERALTEEIAAVVPTQVQLSLDNAYTASLDDVMNSLENPAIKILDARSAEEYAGLKSSSARAGHIPGAVNLDWLDAMDKTNNLRLLPLPVLQEKFLALGITAEQRIITHCQSHHRSGLTYLVAKLLGYQVQAYDGSWSEWGNLPHTPIEVIG